jgi:hypothetical protein
MKLTEKRIKSVTGAGGGINLRAGGSLATDYS